MTNPKFARHTPEHFFARRLRERREALGLSQAAVAEALRAESGISLDPTAITRIESNDRRISLDEAVALATILGIGLPRPVSTTVVSTTVVNLNAAARLVGAMVEQRKNTGLSQTDVAKAMHDIGFRWHQPTVAKVENGERPLRFDEGIALADLFEIDLTSFRSTFDAVCRTCFNRPPSGFSCNVCGRSS